jgi:poly-gamma-glutamate synthesis protein (capsule biosynthesis protein)
MELNSILEQESPVYRNMQQSGDSGDASGANNSAANTSQLPDLDQFTQPSVVQQAQAGDCRAIAYWLNAYLMSQGLYAQVTPEELGSLRVLVEFTRMPQRDRLLRFICHRLCKLNSPHFNAARIQGRFRGTRLVLWDQTVRWTAPAAAPLPAEKIGLAESWEKSRQTLEQLEKQVSFQVNRLTRPLRSTLQLPFQQSDTSQAMSQAQTTALVKVTHPRAADPSSGFRFNHPVLVGSALTAFALGTGSQVLQHYVSGDTAGQVGDWLGQFASEPAEQVQTAVGLVPVQSVAIAHSPEGPIATLVFGGDAWIQQAPFPSPGAALHPAERLLPFNPYQIADVALTNLDDFADLESPGNIEADGSELLADMGIDLVTLPAEHPIDGSGEAAFRRSLAAALEQVELADLEVVGTGKNQQDARRPEILEVRGQRIAYLGYADSQMNPAGRWSAGTNPITDAQLATDIQAIRDQVDWVIVNYRWTGELGEYPADWQVRLARQAIDQGADLVVGHHPDVLQGAEIYNGRAIAYSLGDFIFDDSVTEATDYDTAVLKVSLGDQQMRLELLPVQVRQSQPRVVDAEQGKSVLTYLRNASALFEQPLQSPQVLDLRRGGDHQSAPAEENDPASGEDPPGDSFVDFPDIAPPSLEPDQSTRELPTATPDKVAPEEIPPFPATRPEAEELERERSFTPSPSLLDAEDSFTSDEQNDAEAVAEPTADFDDSLD